MNARELVALGLSQDGVSVAYDALRANGLISYPAEGKRRIAEILGYPDVNA